MREEVLNYLSYQTELAPLVLKPQEVDNSPTQLQRIVFVASEEDQKSEGEILQKMIKAAEPVPVELIDKVPEYDSSIIFCALFGNFSSEKTEIQKLPLVELSALRALKQSVEEKQLLWRHLKNAKAKFEKRLT